MIKGCIGFSYISGRLYGHMLIVRGKRVINIPLPIGVYHVMVRLWKRKNILGKILFKKEPWSVQMEQAKSL
tara:strand:- start:53 stop:265 length:213 start_codon:yes stop_codon:yes gene_type:complete